MKGFRLRDYFWFLPLTLYMLLRVFWQNIGLSYEAVLAAIHNGDFFMPYSMAYDVWVTAIFALLAMPWACLVIILRCFDPTGAMYARRYRWAFFTAAGTYALCIVLLVTVDGSWPWVADAQNQVHLRLFPFIPYGSGWVNVP